MSSAHHDRLPGPARAGEFGSGHVRLVLAYRLDVAEPDD
jgi:hypothetical protein